MPDVFRLAYVDLSTPALEGARQYYRDVLGASEAETSETEAYLTLGLDHHNLALRSSNRPGLNAIGLQLAGGIDLCRLADRLNDLEFRAEVKTNARPGVPALVEVRDVGGHTFELFSTITAPACGFGRRGIGPSRLGHLALLTTDAARLRAFLCDSLGFIVTDWFGEVVTFVTCNGDHHVLNLIDAPVAALHHLAFQLDGREHQFRSGDLLARHGIPVLWGPTRHTAGHNIAAYHHGADGALIELYCDMDVFIPELGYCEPRHWHEDLPQRPKTWPLDALARWNTRYEFDLTAVAFGVGPHEGDQN